MSSRKITIAGRWFTAVADAAAEMGLMLVAEGFDSPRGASIERDNVIPLVTNPDNTTEAVSKAAMVMIPDCDDIVSVKNSFKKDNPDQIVAIRISASPAVAQRVYQLAIEGAEVVHLVFDKHGREDALNNPRHMRDVLREVHGELIKAGLRDQLTLIASGGIALAEHVAKAVICGADLVAIDLPLMVALECRLCGECQRNEICPIALEEVDADYAVRRIVNLVGAWHQQLIELLGAMGIREARRLRGETGRCMFFEDLERETFGRLFGKRKVQEEAV